MADAAKVVGEWIGKLLLDEAKLLYGVEDKVKILREQLKWMQACLLDAENSGCESYVLSLYVSQVKELAKESQDVIQSYLEKVLAEEGDASSSNWMGKMSRSVQLIRSIQPRHEVDSKINDLIQKMSTLKSNLKIFKVDLILDRDSNVGGQGMGNGAQVEEAAVGGKKPRVKALKGEMEKLVDDIVKLQQQ